MGTALGAPEDGRTELARRILALPPDRQALAVAHLQRLELAKAKAAAEAQARPGARAHAARDPKRRRAYAGDPWGYFADVLGITLVPDQEEALELIERYDRVLLPSANGVGKTYLLAGYGIYRLDAVAALEDPENGHAEQGGRVLLPGPDHPTIRATIYSKMLVLAARAESRGHLMPGRRSEDSVLWRVRPEWEVEAFSPPKSTTQEVAAGASGRHHRNQVALIEEGQGVEARIWRAAEGMCSSEGNKIISPFNPTEPVGAAFQRARGGVYRVFHMDGFRHPNIVERRPAVPDAISAATTDARVVADCQDRGPFPGTPLDPDHGDFVYALPPVGADGMRTLTPGRRADGIMGDVRGTPRVYRPNNAFQAQVRGQWSTGSEGGLFSPAAVDAAMARWRVRTADGTRFPAGPAHRVGVDPAREGDDDAIAIPSWGDTAGALLRRYALAQAQGPAAVAALQAEARLLFGTLTLLAKGDGVDQAGELARRFPGSPFVIDMGKGESHVDHLGRMLKRDVTPVSFGAAALPPVPGEPYSENVRTQMYVRLAMLAVRGLCDLPDDAGLREELLAHRVTLTYRTAEVRGADGIVRREKVPSVALIPKDEIKKMIGRSPDKADAAVLAAHHDPTPPKRRSSRRASYSYESV